MGAGREGDEIVTNALKMSECRFSKVHIHPFLLQNSAFYIIMYYPQFVAF